MKAIAKSGVHPESARGNAAQSPVDYPYLEQLYLKAAAGGSLPDVIIIQSCCESPAWPQYFLVNDAMFPRVICQNCGPVHWHDFACVEIESDVD